MNQYAAELWRRAAKAFSTARGIVNTDPDAAASRAYYAAFFAVSALFGLEGKDFPKHSAVEAAVHRDLIKTGRLPAELGADYHALVELRATADYGGIEHVTVRAALQALDRAQRILDAVQTACPDLTGADEQ